MVASRGHQARFPTITNQLYQLAAGTVTSDQLVRRSLDAIEASQSGFARIDWDEYRVPEPAAAPA